MGFPYSSGDLLTAADLNQSSGLVLIKTQTIGSGVSSVTVTDAFSSTFDNYLVTITDMASSASTNLTLTVGGAGTGYYATATRTFFTSTTVTVVNNYASANLYGGQTTTTGNSFYQFKFYQPYKTTFTGIEVRSFGGGYFTNGAGIQSSTTSYTSFTFEPNSGTLTGGALTLYGYNNG